MSDDTEQFIMSKRQRRSNAGNKMKALLEQEIKDMENRTQHMNEDELDFLFQDEENDEEFNIGDDDDVDAETSATEASLGDDKQKHIADVTNEEVNNDDMMLSESESDKDEDEDDEEAGEKELKRQEKLSSKRKRSKNKIPLIVKRAKVSDNTSSKDKVSVVKRKHSNLDLLSADSLLETNRRTSKRSSVVANKLMVFEKLSKAEEKRKIIQERIRKQKEQQKEHILTQEDRLNIAIETERINLQSLNKYKEQELSKKKSRMAMQAKQKMKFKNGDIIISHLSTAMNITPIMEIEDRKFWEEQLQKRNKKKKKYPKRPTKKQLALAAAAAAAEEQKKKEEAKKESNIKDTKQQSQISTGEESKIKTDPDNTENINDSSIKSPSQSVEPVIPSTEQNTTSNDDGSQSEVLPPPETKAEVVSTAETKSTNDTPLAGSIDKKDKVEEENVNTITKMAKIDSIIKPTESENDESRIKTNDIENDNVNSKQANINSNSEIENTSKNMTSQELSRESSTINTDSQIVADSTTPTAIEEKSSADVIDHTSSNSNDDKENVSDSKLGSESIPASNDDTTVKQVVFSEKLDIKIIDQTLEPVKIQSDSNVTSEDDSIFEKPNEDSKNDKDDILEYEGPDQLLAKNFITLYKFGTEKNIENENNVLFGEEWNHITKLPDNELEPILKLTKLEENKNSMDKFAFMPNLSFLDNFPAFGEYHKKMVHDTGEEFNKEMDIVIKTPACTGVFLPNGNRKKCLISHKPCQYFDPKNGVPYSDVEAYKVIQELMNPVGEEGTEEEPKPRFQWFGFSEGGLFMDITQQPAKGVPEGFY